MIPSTRFHSPGSLSPWRPTPPTISLWFLSLLCSQGIVRHEPPRSSPWSSQQVSRLQCLPSPKMLQTPREPLPLMFWDPDSRLGPFRPCAMSGCRLGVCFRERRKQGNRRAAKGHLAATHKKGGGCSRERLPARNTQPRRKGSNSL